MRTTLTLLLALVVGFACRAQVAKSAAPKPSVKVVHNDRLLTLTARELEAKNLRRVYGKALRVSKVERNHYEKAVQDTFLVADTNGDKLRLFTNKYNAFLLSGRFTSQGLSFGRGTRVGTAKAAFCRAIGLPATFDGYRITATDSDTNLYFLFRQDKLVSVEYEAGSVE